MGKEWPGFGERLGKLIREKGYKNAAQFADDAGIRITYVYKWLSGTIPERENLIRLGAIFDVSPAWLQWGDEVAREPLRRRAKKVLACLLAALLGISTGSVATTVHALPVTKIVGATSYRKWFIHLVHRLWGLVETRAHFMGQGYTRLVTVERYA